MSAQSSRGAVAAYLAYRAPATYAAAEEVFTDKGATLEVEFNNVHQKLMRGLGIVAIENQARI